MFSIWHHCRLISGWEGGYYTLPNHHSWFLYRRLLLLVIKNLTIHNPDLSKQ
jgi:hypothetical protein